MKLKELLHHIKTMVDKLQILTGMTEEEAVETVLHCLSSVRLSNKK